MGFNSNPQQPQTPQQQAAGLQALRTAAVTPYRGTAPGGGAAQGAAQLVAALLARRKAQQLQAGNPGGATPIPQSVAAQRNLQMPPGAGPTPLPQPTAPATQAGTPQPMPMPTPMPQPMPVNPAPLSTSLT